MKNLINDFIVITLLSSLPFLLGFIFVARLFDQAPWALLAGV